jgi:hypothetical protein
MINEITMRINPVKKWTNRTTFCMYSKNINIHCGAKLMAWKSGKLNQGVTEHYLSHRVFRKAEGKAIC